MDLIEWLKKAYRKVMLINKLLWFAVNLMLNTPPFKKFSHVVKKLIERIKVLQQKID